MAKLGCFEEGEELKQLQFGVLDSASDGMNRDLKDDSEQSDELDCSAEIDAYPYPTDEEVCLEADKDHVDGIVYDPMSTIVREGVKDVFLELFANKKSPPVRVSVGDYPKANVQWFRRVWTNTDGFAEHVTGFVFKKWFSIPKKNRKEWDWSRQEMFVKKYVLDTYPLNDNYLHWREAKKVFSVAHVNQNHWVPYKLCLEDKVITVYDSLFGGGRRPNPRHMSEFRKLAMMMPSIYKGLIKSGGCTDDEKSWEVKLWSDTP